MQLPWRMKKLLTDLRSSFWFIPALVVALAAALALGAVELDAAVGDAALAKHPRLFGAGAEGTRQLLSAIASSTITVAGVVFSITIVALSLTAAQYSPRVLRNFMRDRANQLVLGIFVGIYVYCLLVLRTIRGGEDAFVPGISMLGGVGFALIGIGVLIFFIHHIATSIQVSEIAARVARETVAALAEQHGRPGGQADPQAPALPDQMSWRAVPALATGYIQAFEKGRLLDYARDRRCTVRMERAAGDFVVAGEMLLSVAGADPDEAQVKHLNRASAINTYRDVAQDPAFGVQQLVDIALKALSPGINDTATARNSLDYLTAILFEAARHPQAAEERYSEGGRLLLVAMNRSFDFYIASTFDPIRRSSVHDVDMMVHSLRALARIARSSRTAACRVPIAKQLDAIEQTIAGGTYAAADKSKLDLAVHEVRNAIARDDA